MAELVINPVTRIYGNASLRVTTDEGESPRAHFSAFGYRGFERIARGAHLDNLLPIVSRICGADSLFHQAAASMAVERALGVEPPASLQALRELALWAQFFERHAVSLSVHSLPDLLFPSSDPGLRNLVSIYRVDEEVVRRLMSLKSLGTVVLSEVGGAAVHPVNFRPGGAAREVSEETRRGLAEKLREAGPLLVETARLVKLLLRRNEELVRSAGNTPSSSLAMRHPEGMAIVGGTPAVLTPGGETATALSPQEIEGRLRESSSSHSHVIHAELEGVGEARVGPLARLNVNGSYGTPMADEELAEVREIWGFPVQYCLVSHVLRMLEMIHAWEKMLALLEKPPGDELGVMLRPSAGKALQWVEAPEGALVYKLELTEEGLVKSLAIVSPLQFNLRSLEKSLAETFATSLAGPEGEKRTANLLQMVVRAYAPCVPCGVH